MDSSLVYQGHQQYYDTMIVCEKLNDAQKAFNKRVLHIQEGIIKYYSVVPKGFDPDSPAGLGQPKAGVSVDAILELYDNDDKLPKSLQDKLILFTFPKRDLLTTAQMKKQSKPQKELKKSVTMKPATQLLKWVFMFDDRELRNKWGDIFSKNIEHYHSIDASVSINSFVATYKLQPRMTIMPDANLLQRLMDDDQGRTFGQDDPDHGDDDLLEAKNDMKQKRNVYEQFKQDRAKFDEIRKKEEDLERERQRILQEEEQRQQGILKEEDERKRREEELKLLRKEQERQMRIKVQTAWEFRYFLAMEDCIDAASNFDESMRTGIKMVKLLEVFREQAQRVVQDIVQDLIEQKVKRVANPRESSAGRNPRESTMGRRQSRAISADPDNRRKSTLQPVNSKSLYLRKPERRKRGDEQTTKETLQDLADGKLVFHRNNMMIRIACAQTTQRVLWFSKRSYLYKAIENRYIAHLKQGFDNLFTYNEHAFLSTSVHSKRRTRQLQEEFKALNYLNDMCMTIRKNEKNFRIKVPLSCIIEYMGFTALVIAKPPCFMDENSLAYGPSSFDGTYKCSGKLDKEIELLGRSLSIKPHVFAWNVSENQSKQRKTMSTVEDKEKRQVIYLSFFTEVHVGKFEEFEQLKSMLKVYSEEEIDIFEMRRQGIFYLNKCQDIMPNLLEEEYAQLFEVIQQVKVSSDLEIDQKELTNDCLKGYPTYRVRPEFLQSYFGTGYETKSVLSRLYNPDAYETISDAHADQTDLAEMSKFYKRNYVAEFVKKVDDMEICPIDSHTLREAMRMFGISMRQLGDVARYTKLPHIRSLLEVEMIARTLKNIFFTQLAEDVLATKEESIPLKNSEFKSLQQQMAHTDPEDEDRQIRNTNSFKRASMILPLVRLNQDKMSADEYLDHIYKENLIDFLNLIFSPSSVLFWEQVIQKQVWSDFNYDLEVNVKGLCPGGLLHALAYNMKIEIDFEPMEVYFSTPYPTGTTQEVVNRYKLKQYLVPKSYQQFFTESINAEQQTQGFTNPPSHRSIGAPRRINFFGMDDITVIRFDVQSYSLHDLEIVRLCAKFNQFKHSNPELALKTLSVQLNIIDGLAQSHSSHLLKSSVYNDMAQLYLKLGNYQQCVVRVSLSIQLLMPIVLFEQDPTSDNYTRVFMNTLLLKQRVPPRQGMVRPLMVLLQCCIENQALNEYVLGLFDLIMFIIEFTFGPQHPIYAQVFAYMGQFFMQRDLHEDAKDMYRSQIICLLQTVGQSHRIIAEAYLQMGRFLHQTMKHKDQSIVHYEKASLIFESLYGTNSQQCTGVAVQLAEVLSDCGRVKQALEQCEVALKYYATRVHGNIHTILVLKYLRADALGKLKQTAASKREVEDFFRLLNGNWSSVCKGPAPDTELSTPKSSSEYTKPLDIDFEVEFHNDLGDTIGSIFAVYLQFFLQEVTKEHRNFLYQVYDQILENMARDGILESIEELQYREKAIYFIMSRIRKLASVQAYFDKMMGNFIESTGADANRFIFNFKKDQQNAVYAPFPGVANFAEAIEYYENVIVALGRQLVSNHFLVVMIN